jgi:peptidoglycan/LPS O-acetylase OafA/YrhL
MDRLGVINGLRGIAIIGTVFHHSFFEHFRYGMAGSHLPWLVDVLASSAWLGVNLFFFLSGFVLYLPYEQGKRQMRTRDDALHFYRRRFARLMPLYTLVWVVSLVFMTDLQLTQPSFYEVALLYLTCLFPFYPGSFFPPGNFVMWSLGAEIWFSVLLPFVVVAIHRFGWRATLVSAVVFALAVRVAGQLALGAPDVPLNMVSDSVLGRLDEFLLGMFAAHLYTRGVRFSVRHLLAGVALMLAGALIWAWRYQGAIPPVSGAIANNFLDDGLTLATLALLTAPLWGARLLEARWLQLLGMMCYSLYLWHGIVLLHYQSSAHAGVPEYLAYLTIVFVLSALTYRYIEFRSASSWSELLPQVARRRGPPLQPERT